MRCEYSEVGNINGPRRRYQPQSTSGAKDSCPCHMQNTFTLPKAPQSPLPMTALAQNLEFRHLSPIQVWMKLLSCSSSSRIWFLRIRAAKKMKYLPPPHLTCKVGHRITAINIPDQKQNFWSTEVLKPSWLDVASSLIGFKAWKWFPVTFGCTLWAPTSASEPILPLSGKVVRVCS